MEEKAILARIDALLDIPWDHARERSLPAEVSQGAVTLLEAVHGKGCEQTSILKNRIARIEKIDRYAPLSTFEAAKGSLRALKAEIESGIVGSLTRTITGEVLGDFIRLSSASLEQGGEASKNVAAVLAAAAFEETIRRMGAALRFCSSN